MSYDIYTGLLKAFDLPTQENKDINFSYDNNHPKFSVLKEYYPIESVAGDGNDFSRAVNLLNWVSGHIYHMGNYSGSIAQNALDLLNHSFDKDSSCGINCVGLSTILSECLLSIGLKARKVFIMPCSPYDGDNHVVVHVYIASMNKWVMLDPTLNAYIKNEHGAYLDLFELRNHLADQKPIFFNDEVKYNDETWTVDSAKENIEYFAKNLFYFQASEITSFDNSDVPGNRFITLCPQGYNPKKMRLANIEYRIKNYGDNPNMKKWYEEAKEEKHIFCSIADFIKI